MAKTASTMLQLGTSAPDFALYEPKSGATVRLNTYANQPIVVIFICNHCPYVKLIAEKLSEVAKIALSKGVALVAINSNDVSNYPDDSPEKMVAMVEQYDFTFPYLFDETQEVAKAYRAACTPDLFLFDANHKLHYRGQFDSARPNGTVAVSGEDLLAAVDALLQGNPVEQQTPSLGCNIKWKPGNEPDYFG